MSYNMRIKAKAKNGETEVKALMDHPMETGNHKDAKTGEKIPAHFIKELTCEHNGKNVMTAYLSSGVSKNPYVAFTFKGGAKDDSVKISWTDSNGETNTSEVKIS